MESQRTKKQSLKKSKPKRLIVTDFKTYHKAIIIKVVWY
jgi:hypothetical protein